MVTFDWNWLKLRPRGTRDGIEVKVFDVASCVKEEFHFLHSNILTSPLGNRVLLYQRLKFPIEILVLCRVSQNIAQVRKAIVTVNFGSRRNGIQERCSRRSAAGQT